MLEKKERDACGGKIERGREEKRERESEGGGWGVALDEDLQLSFLFSSVERPVDALPRVVSPEPAETNKKNKRKIWLKEPKKERKPEERRG